MMGVAASPFLLNIEYLLIPHICGSGLILGLGGAIGIGYTKYSVHRDVILSSKNKKKIEILYSTNSQARIISYGCLVTGMSIITAPICVIFPHAVFSAFIASFLINQLC